MNLVPIGTTIERRLKPSRATAVRQARPAVLSSRSEPNSAVPSLKVTNGVLLPFVTIRLQMACYCRA